MDIRGLLRRFASPKAEWKTGRANRAFGGFSSPSGPNAANTGYLPALRNRARDAVRNDPIATRAIETMVANLIGTGITPKFLHDNPDTRRIAQAYWQAWEDEADADSRTDIYGLQALAVRAWLESGECFVRLRPRRPEDGLSVPLQLQVLEADFVPLIDATAPNGNAIRAGIEFNAIGQRVNYWMHKQHPGDNTGGGVSLTDLTPVPAESVLHLYEALRPGQLRGVPRLSNALQRLKQLSDYDEASLERQKTAAGISMVIKRPAPLDPGVDPVTGERFDSSSAVDASPIRPGMAYTLLPGEEIDTPDLPDQGSTYDVFVRRQLQAIAAGLSIPYEILAGDYQGVNDRVMRVALNEFRRRLEQIQWSVIIPQFCRPLFLAWRRMAVLSGALPSAALTAKVRWTPQAWAYIHPVQDVDAQLNAINGGLKSRSAVLLAQGEDPEQVDVERAEDWAREERLNLPHVDANSPTGNGNPNAGQFPSST